MPGPLSDVRILEIGGIGPNPFAGMLFADLGAEVIRVDRPTGGADFASHRILLRGRRSLVLDLKNAQARDIMVDLAASADALIEGFRPGVMERLGLGPQVMLARNRRLVFGRMTGWGQDGPLATAAGHDINYIAVAGALQPLSARGAPPMPPLNMLGDFGGGAMLLACGVLAGILHARATGTGQVVDAAIVDGTALMTAMLHSLRAEGHWSAPPGGNLLDGGAPYYGVYESADGGWLAVGALEPQFYAQLLSGLGLTDELAGVRQDDQSSWPWMRDRFAKRIRERSRSDWLTVFEGTDACVTAALGPHEVLDNAHIASRRTFVRVDGLVQPAPAPRFEATPAQLPDAAPLLGADSRAILQELGRTVEEIDALVDGNVVGAPPRR